jgi:hypothetical protein
MPLSTNIFNSKYTMKSNLAIVATMLAALLAGCSKEPPKCSEEKTITLIQKIVIDKFGGREGLGFDNWTGRSVANGLLDGVSDKVLYDSLKIEFPRASGYDEKIKKYTCSAKLVAGGAYEMPIVYASQLDDSGTHLVALGDLGWNVAQLRDAVLQYLKNIREAKALKAGGVSKVAATSEVAPLPASDGIVGTWASEASGKGETRMEAGKMRIDATAEAGKFSVALDTSGPNGCTGSIVGQATQAKNTLTLKGEEGGEVCTVSIKFEGGKANISEDSCGHYHGMQCSLDDSMTKKK